MIYAIAHEIYGSVGPLAFISWNNTVSIKIEIKFKINYISKLSPWPELTDAYGILLHVT